MLVRTSRIAALALSLTCLSVNGCRKQELATDEVGQAEGQPVPATPEDLQGMLSRLGDRGVCVLVLRDAGWGESVGPVLERFGLGSSVEPAARSPVGLLWRLLESMRIGEGTGELRGRDPARPIVASLFEAPIDGAMTSATALQALRVAAHMGIREQVLIPASDAAALVDSLAELLGDLEAWPELVGAHPQARAWQLSDGFLAALPEGDVVRVVVIHGASGLDPSEDLVRWQAQLESSTAAPIDTPALRHLGQADASLAVLLRPWRMRAAFSWEGLFYGRLALHDAPPDRSEEVIARATALVLGGELVMPDEGAEFDDWAVTVSRSDNAVRVRAVGSATELGQQVLAAAKLDAPVTITSGRLSIESWLAIDRASAAATGSPTAALGPISSADAIELWRNCGIGCSIHGALRMPFGAARSPVGGQLRVDVAKWLEGERAPAGSVRMAAAGSALAIELVLGEPGEFTFNPGFADIQWPSPLRAAEASPGDACIARAGLGTRRVLWSLVENAPEQRASTVLARLAEHEDDFRCAIEHPPTAAAGTALRRMLVEAAVGAELAILAIDRAQALLERSCTQYEDPELCARKQLLAAMPRPVLASSKHLKACEPALENRYWRPGELNGLPLYVSGDEISLGERSLPSDAKAIATAIVERSTDGVAPLALVVDRNTKHRALEPVFAALAALDVRELALVVLNDGGQLYSVPLRFRGTKTFEVELPKREGDPDEPPPPEEPPPEDDPPEDEDGHYEMLPGAVPLMERGEPEVVLELDGTGVKLTQSESRPEQLTLEQLRGRLDDEFVMLRVSPTTPWSSVVALATNVCPQTLTLDQSAN